MAIYHTRVKTFSRAKGHSAVAAAAYRAGLSLVDERTGARHDYSRRGGVVESRWVVPLKAPDWSLDAAKLWQAAEAAEKRKDATVAREFEIALPHELNGPQRSALTADIARALVDRYGFAVQASIHRALRGLAAVRRRAMEWLRRVEAERRAASLLTRAERSLEDFIEQQPRPTGAALVAWARRRGRRLAAIEQRLDALRKARTKIEDGQEEACANQLSAAVAELEAGSRVALDQLEDPLHETGDPAKLTVSMPQATPRPGLH